jgi:tRNA (guanine-N7-)-methyltransferase
VTRSLKYDIPGPDWRVSAEDVRAKGWAALFAEGETPIDVSRGLVVDVGFGRGEFLAELARRSPDVPHVGIERAFKRVLKQARRLARSELSNVRLLHERAEVAVEELLEPGSVATFWVNFPDPWPKKRHGRRRLLQPAFVHALALRLRPGGRLEVATDDAAYADEIEAALVGEALLESVIPPDARGRRFAPEVPGRIPTAYELEWRAEGRPLHFFTFRRIAGTLPA